MILRTVVVSLGIIFLGIWAFSVRNFILNFDIKKEGKSIFSPFPKIEFPSFSMPTLTSKEIQQIEYKLSQPTLSTPTITSSTVPALPKN